jgi:aspartyl/asparaginyl beta-hydroxylase (cupin superfamily)
VIDGERKFMRVGEIWEVNNNKVHQVWNEGDTDRVHLLIDIIPNNVIGDNDV